MKVTNLMKMENWKMNQIMLKSIKKFIQNLNQSQTLNLTIHAKFWLWKRLVIKDMTVLVSLHIKFYLNCKKWPNCELWRAACTQPHTLQFSVSHTHHMHVCVLAKIQAHLHTHILHASSIFRSFFIFGCCIFWLLSPFDDEVASKIYK